MKSQDHPATSTQIIYTNKFNQYLGVGEGLDCDGEEVLVWYRVKWKTPKSNLTNLTNPNLTPPNLGVTELHDTAAVYKN